MSDSTLFSLLDRARFFFHQPPPALDEILRYRVICQAFFEPSTRTRNSFDMAAKRLGAKVINLDVETSSVKKGETVYDTLKTLESLGADAITVRHADDRIFDSLKNNFHAPLINAGAGKHEHPSQGLLDLFTLREEFGKLEGLHVAICGDIRHSRVAGSLMVVAKRLGIKVSLCGPELMLPEIKSLPAGCEIAALAEVLPKVDALMCLRNQFERHTGLAITPEEFHRDYGLTHARLNIMQKHAIIMHPAPVNRGIEIADDLVEHARSRIFSQMKNGVYVRMSILDYVLNGGQS